MTQDEQEIRGLIATWNERTKSGDVEGVLALMTDDVVFTVVGRPPFGKAEFAASARKLQGSPIDARADVLEVVVRGDTAWARVQLRVSMTRPDGEQVSREGYAMSIYTREAGNTWLLTRDANMLGPAA